METGKRKLKPYHGIILLILSAIDIFLVGPIFGKYMGIFGSLASELLLLLLSVAVVLIVKGDLKAAFPMYKPKLVHIFGTLIFWLASYLSVMAITLLVTMFFPKQVMEASDGISSMVMSAPLFLAVVVVSMSPAICEEAVFRGVVLNSFRGSMNKWAAILISGIIFGSFHGSIWRAIPTSLLGIMMGYLLVETNNILYTAVFHAINNLVPIIILAITQKILPAGTMEAEMAAAQTMQIPVTAFGSALMYCSAVPFLMYVGNHLIHKGQAGYEHGLFSKKDKKKIIILCITTAAFLVVGFLVSAVGMMMQMQNLMR